MACRDRCVAFVSTFACFLTRAFDNFRMGVISQTNINVVGSRKYIHKLDIQCISMKYIKVLTLQLLIFGYLAFKIVVCLSVKMAHLKWHWKTLQCSDRYPDAPYFIQVMLLQRKEPLSWPQIRR